MVSSSAPASHRQSRRDQHRSRPGLFYPRRSHIADIPLLVGYRHTLNGSGAGFYLEPFAGYAFGGTDITKMDAEGNIVYNNAGNAEDENLSAPPQDWALATSSPGPHCRSISASVMNISSYPVSPPRISGPPGLLVPSDRQKITALAAAPANLTAITALHHHSRPDNFTTRRPGLDDIYIRRPTAPDARYTCHPSSRKDSSLQISFLPAIVDD